MKYWTYDEVVLESGAYLADMECSALGSRVCVAGTTWIIVDPLPLKVLGTGDQTEAAGSTVSKFIEQTTLWLITRSFNLLT